MRLILAILVCSVTLSAQTFAPAVEVPTVNQALAGVASASSWFGGVTACDWDGDGYTDFAVTQHGSQPGVIFRNTFPQTGLVGFEVLQVGNTPKSDWKPHCVDLDGDGRLDMPGFTDDTNSSSLFNDPTGFVLKTPFFKGMTSPNMGCQPGHLTRSGVMDADGDGDIDIRDRGWTRSRFLAGTNGSDHLVNPATRTVTVVPTTYVPPTLPQALQDYIVALYAPSSSAYLRVNFYDCLNVAGDSQDDVIVTGAQSYSSTRFLRLLVRQPDGSLVDETVARGLPLDGTVILIRDLTGDGLTDLVVHARTAVGVGGVYIQQPNGTFVKQAHTSLNATLNHNSSYISHAETRYLDNGLPALFVGNPYGGSLRVYRANGAGFDTTPILQLVGAYGQPETAGFNADAWDVGHLNNDALLDVMFCRGTYSLTPKCEFYINTSAPPPAPPTITTSSLPDAITDESYSVPLGIVGGVPPYVWNLTDGSLPPGITLTPEGVLNGAASLVFPVTVRACDALAACDDQDLTMLVVQPPSPLAEVPTLDSPIQITHQRYIQELEYRRYLELSIRELQNELNRRDMASR